MKIRLIAFFISVLFVKTSVAQQFNYKTYPSFDSIINSLNNHYKLQGEPGGNYYQLARKPDGWYLMEYNYSVNEYSPVREWLYWSGADGSFHSLSLTSGKSPDWLPLGYKEDKENFVIHPYWGYENWSKDVIQIFEHKKLNDSLTYALGRAYSNEAGNSLWKHEVKDITKQNIELFISNDKKAITCFQKTMQLNPHFETKVGNIFTKYCDEYMFAWYSLAESGLNEEAKQFLPDSLYDPFMLSTARNFLMSCPENALLVTMGDNDTYPLIYLQEKMGYRKDVTICNYGLLGTINYIRYLRKDKSIGMTVPEKVYSSLTTRAVYIDSTMESESLENVIKTLSDTSSRSTGFIKSKNIFFSFGFIDKVAQKNRLSVVSLAFPNKYLFSSDVVLLDFLYTNGINANICFTSSCDSSIYKPFKHYMQMRGLVYEFTGTSFQNLDKQSPVPGMNIPETITLLQKNFDYHFEARDSTSREAFISSYKYLFIECIAALIQEQNNSKSAELVKQYMLTFPPSAYDYGSMEILLVKQLIKLNDDRNTNAICSGLMNEGNIFLWALKRHFPVNRDDLTKWLLISGEIKKMDGAGLEKDIKTNASRLYESLLHYYK